jgi:murein L,D-transpeptidase YcbB/YkuD
MPNALPFSLLNKIIFPQELGQQGPAVGDLQDVLLALLERAAILPDEPNARRELAALLTQERQRRTFRPNTNKLVSIFQDERGLVAHGTVDEPTA